MNIEKQSEEVVTIIDNIDFIKMKKEKFVNLKLVVTTKRYLACSYKIDIL